MKRKIKVTIVFVVFFALAFGIYSIIKKIDHKKEIAKEISKLPYFQINTINGSGVVSNTSLQLFDRKYILFFNTDCPHCQYEIKSICENINKFYNTCFLLISNENKEVLRKFYTDNKLNKYPIYVASDSTFTVCRKFDAYSFPSTYVYGKDNTLIRVIIGEVKIELLLNPE